MLNTYPSALQPYLQGSQLLDCSCCSEATTFFVDRGYYLKIAPKGSLAQEARFTQWFYAKGLSVKVVLYLSEDKDYLLTKKAEGEVLTNCLDQPKELCRALATGLHQLQSLSVKDFPSSNKLDVYIQSAEANYHKGCFDKSLLVPWMDFTDREEAWQVFQANKHLLKSEVVVHGDYCLPNVLMKDGQFSGFIDLGQAGIGDRHTDIYWAIWSLWYNLKTDQYTDCFLDFYGRHLVNDNLLRTIAAIETFA